jgi:hypothetical protein
MAQSSEIYNQIQGLLGQVNPMLEQLPTAEQYYKDKTNEAFNYNLGPLQNAAELESKMYSMPGNLMSQYDQEFGGKTGISSNQRINSILSQLGNQSGLVNTARGLANQSGANINELANTLLGQYRSGIEAKQQQMSPLMSIWDRMFSEENANERARLARSGSGTPSSPYLFSIEDIEAEIARRLAEANKKTVTAPSPASSAGQKATSLQSGTFRQDYLTPKTTVPGANTSSSDFNRLVNNFRGI